MQSLLATLPIGFTWSLFCQCIAERRLAGCASLSNARLLSDRTLPAVSNMVREGCDDKCYVHMDTLAISIGFVLEFKGVLWIS